MATNTTTDGLSDFTSSPVTLMNEFATYLQTKQNKNETKNSLAFLGDFSGFLVTNKSVLAEETRVNTFTLALTVSKVHDCWVIDFGAIDHASNDRNLILDFKILSPPSQILVANGDRTPVVRQGKVKLHSQTITSFVLYVPSFPFKLLSIKKITIVLNCVVTLLTILQYCVQDLATKKTISEGFLFQGLYYLQRDPCFFKGLHVNTSLDSEQK